MSTGLLTAEEVRDQLRLDTAETVTRWLRAGKLRGFKVGSEWRIPANAVEEFLAEHANSPDVEPIRRRRRRRIV